ncbi:WD40 repeat-like protein [Hesseltinella vesiculosa]|uniref:WD40 repeat-like protein n=1 Tax=Hesseltinella vesiculosa TaxID=101127 RepID=A0A1X2GRX1_9FUNG|nr:WD40 repeat-like protein [Hesseltinella vesiculosa]
MVEESTDYRQFIWQELKERDEHEQQYHVMISSNQHLLKQVNHYRVLAASQKISGNAAHLEQQIQHLKEERADMYKVQSENAQRLVHMNDKLRTLEDLEAQQKKSLVDTLANNKKLADKSTSQTEQLREKDGAIQVLQDELSALQLEITTIEGKNHRLSKENHQLVQRWMEKMNQEADKMNEATEFYETALQRARSQQSPTNSSNRPGSVASTASSSSPSNKDQHKMRVTSIILPDRPYRTLANIHDGDIYCIQASRTGTYFATGSEDRRIKLFDRYSMTSTTLSGSLQSITSLDFNTTDDFLVATSTDYSTRVWNLGTRRLAHTLTGHIGKVFAARFIPADSSRVVTGSHDRTIKVWDLTKGWCTRTIFSFSSCNDLAVLDPDGHTLVSGHLDNTLRLWDTKSGNGIKDLQGLHRGQITSVAVSPDGGSVLTNSRDNTLKWIDIRMYEVLHTFQAPTYQNGINWSRASFSPDGCYVAAGGKDGSIHIWNTRNMQLERVLQGFHKSAVCGVAWHSMGSEMYTADMNAKTVCIWDTSIEKKTQSFVMK